MNFLTLVGKFENSSMIRTVEHIKSITGFNDKDTISWVDNTMDTVVTLDGGDDIEDVWKCFVADDSDGVLWLGVCRSLNGRVVLDLVEVADISTLVIS